MSRSPTFEERWLKGVEFTVAEQPRFPHLCAEAQPFVTWCEHLLEPLRKKPTEVDVNVALLQLQTNYMERFEAAPPSHKNHVGNRKGGQHTCLFQVYVAYFKELRNLRWQLNPPPVREPPPPPAPPPLPEIGGVPFGIIKDDAG
jgi:hypothetical protein